MAQNSQYAVETTNGHYVDVFAIQPGDLRVEDIASGLATSSRWGGFYDLDITGGLIFTIAQHAVYVSKDAARFKDPLLELMALHHDDSEGLLKDFPTPIKKGLPWYKLLEKTVQDACYQEFIGFHPATFHKKRIKECDLRLMQLEGALFQKHCVDLNGPKLFRDQFAKDGVWTPKEARNRYIERHYQLAKLAHVGE